MKKTLLLAGVAACLVSANVAKAGSPQMWFGHEVSPYVGLDYIFSHADFSSFTPQPKENYHNISGNIGARIGTYAGIEGFFQQAFERKKRTGANADNLKSKFYAYGGDIQGYLPLGCSGVNLVGSLGLGYYDVKVKFDDGSVSKGRLGWRFGAGAHYDITENWGVRVMARYDYIDAKYLDDMWELTAGVRYTF